MQGNDTAAKNLSEGNEKKSALMTWEMIFSCVKNEKLPGTVRSYFCDLMYLWIDRELESPPTTGIKYTWVCMPSYCSYLSVLRGNHRRLCWEESLFRTRETHQLRMGSQFFSFSNTKAKKNLTYLQEFIKDFLLKNEEFAINDEETRQLVISVKRKILLNFQVLVILRKMVYKGLFIGKADQEHLIKILLSFLKSGKKKDAASGTSQSTKLQRYEMTEANWPIMVWICWVTFLQLQLSFGSNLIL